MQYPMKIILVALGLGIITLGVMPANATPGAGFGVNYCSPHKVIKSDGKVACWKPGSNCVSGPSRTGGHEVPLGECVGKNSDNTPTTGTSTSSSSGGGGNNPSNQFPNMPSSGSSSGGSSGGIGGGIGGGGTGTVGGGVVGTSSGGRVTIPSGPANIPPYNPVFSPAGNLPGSIGGGVTGCIPGTIDAAHSMCTHSYPSHCCTTVCRADGNGYNTTCS